MTGVTRANLKKVVRNKLKRVKSCVYSNGGLFEKLT